MTASLISKTQEKLIVQIEIPLSKSMLEGESWDGSKMTDFSEHKTC